jgi:hypothetical protein
MIAFKGLFANREGLVKLQSSIKDCLGENEGGVAKKEEDGDILYSIEDLMSNVKITKSKPILKPKKDFYFSRIFNTETEINFLVDAPNSSKKLVKALEFKFHDFTLYEQCSGKYVLLRGVITLLSSKTGDVLCFTMNLNNALQSQLFEALVNIGQSVSGPLVMFVSEDEKHISIKQPGADYITYSIETDLIQQTNKVIVKNDLISRMIPKKIKHKSRYFVPEKDKGFVRLIV